MLLAKKTTWRPRIVRNVRGEIGWCEGREYESTRAEMVTGKFTAFLDPRLSIQDSSDSTDRYNITDY